MLVAWVPAERPRPGVAGPVVASWMRQNGSDGASNHPGPGSDARYARVPRNGCLSRRCSSTSKAAIPWKTSLRVSRPSAVNLQFRLSKKRSTAAFPGLMRILLDECVDERLRHLFTEYDCQTARYAGFTGLKNSALLLAAEEAGFDVLVTVDQNIPDQQTLTHRRISVLILCGRTNRLSDLRPLVHAARDTLVSITPGQVARVSG